MHRTWLYGDAIRVSLTFARVVAQGYGDMHPCTPTGQMVAVVWGFFGVAVVALPSGIIGSGLVEVIAEAKAEAKKLAQTRAAKVAASSRAGGAPPTAEEMRDPVRFHDLGLAMLLPPGTVTSSNPQPRQSSAVDGENGGGSDSGGEGLMKRLERAEEEARAARDSLRQRGRRSAAVSCRQELPLPQSFPHTNLISRCGAGARHV